jgi:predicted NACHT family NTPase
MAVELGVFDRIWKLVGGLVRVSRSVVNKRAIESRYRFCLRQEVRSFGILGSPDIENMPVRLDEAFVSLRISPSWRSEWSFDPAKQTDRQAAAVRSEEMHHLTPDDMMKRAFRESRVLLIVGDPGCGKTTLLKYYALCALDKKQGQLGFERQLLPLFFPLRELAFADDGQPLSLAENLAAWSAQRSLAITAQQFNTWLVKRKTLVLLDGLDEIGDLEKRRAACEWIKLTTNGLKNARLVVTARWTGVRKSDCIELECEHRRADVLDFSEEQQQEFLKKWFPAVFMAEWRGPDMPGREWRQRQRKRGEARAGALIDFLQQRENRSIREFSGVPLLLQIMAIVWKERDYRPESRTALFDAALNYLLQYRDQRRGKDLKPLLDADKARRVLGPAALWMQERLQRDEAPKEAMHNFMQPILQTMEKPPTAQDFCRNLVDRAGLIVD